MSTSTIEVSGEKVKEMWDKRLTKILYDICIKEILKGNISGLRWNLIKRTIDASDDWWESRLKDVDNDIPENNEEENVRNDVHISNDVYIDGDDQKRKTPEISTSHFKIGKKKSSKQIRGAVMCMVENSSGDKIDDEREKKDFTMHGMF
ncbi:hypothetical protein PVK06_004820 [Gossypium arboreum]|uniref:Myb/SANT-like domain-containing protein n=1 Tax=Gossypium arboreum TaxID=29729 RepID=A0ABR0QT03_GOSAR|nr:hypothetical protein PVK06_004820 [Gossypium arboreum]